MGLSQIAVSTYDKTATQYTEKYFHDDSDQPYIDELIKLLPKNPLLLDIGCGPGNSTSYLSQNGCHVEGIDLSKEMIKIAITKVPLAHFSIMDMRQLDYPDATFDGILSAYSLIHIPSNAILETLKEFNRVLKVGGIIEIITQQGEADQTVDDHLNISEKMFYNFFTKKRLSDYLNDADFTVLSQKTHTVSNTYNLSDGIIYTIARK